MHFCWLEKTRPIWVSCTTESLEYLITSKCVSQISMEDVPIWVDVSTLGGMPIHSSRNSFVIFDLFSTIVVLNGLLIPHLHYAVHYSCFDALIHPSIAPLTILPRAPDSECPMTRDDERGVGICPIWCARSMADSRRARRNRIPRMSKPLLGWWNELDGMDEDLGMSGWMDDELSINYLSSS